MATFGGVEFTILATDGEPVVGGEEWHYEDRIVTRAIPGATGTIRDVTQGMGISSGTKTHTLLFADESDFDDFVALRQTVATLVDWDGQSYTTTLLERITQPFVFLDGRRRCVATFRRT